MTQPPLVTVRPAFRALALLTVLVFSIVAAVPANAQGAGSTVPEQQIFIAPIGQTATADSEVAVTGEFSLATLCDGPVDRYPSLAENCEAVLTDLVRTLGDRAEADATAVAEAQARAAAFDERSRAHLLTALEQQAQRGTYLFWIAVSLVGLGIVAAGLQFLKSWRSADQTSIELSVSEKQLSLKTSWIGVVLLALSMGFLLIYLLFVYQITPIN